MAREIASLLPASTALPRTRNTKKNYASLAEGPISSKLLKDGMPLLSKCHSQSVSCASKAPLAEEKDVFSSL